MSDTTGGVLDGYVSERDLAEQLHMTPRTMQRWRCQRLGPPVTLIGRAVFYRVEGVRAWLASCEMKIREKRKAA
jgi:hypothetical protein